MKAGSLDHKQQKHPAAQVTEQMKSHGSRQMKMGMCDGKMNMPD